MEEFKPYTGEGISDIDLAMAQQAVKNEDFLTQLYLDSLKSFEEITKSFGKKQLKKLLLNIVRHPYFHNEKKFVGNEEKTAFQHAVQMKQALTFIAVHRYEKLQEKQREEISKREETNV